MPIVFVHSEFPADIPALADKYCIGIFGLRSIIIEYH